ncbi:hypothetical protein [uncultured Clostridium sp.]|uniref:hypothetical protein n=1 Tax=uncultured Clostridium sp. TaxID=59620 RepID=UPI0028E8DB75|nr:hypothetical protein [uncultured Clostridium sp.]
MAKNRIQYLIESFFIFALSTLIVFLVFFTESKITLNIFIILVVLSIFTFEFLKVKKKWFKCQNYFPKWFNILQIIIVTALVRLSYIKKIPMAIGVVYPILMLLCLILVTYKMNFRNPK